MPTTTGTAIEITLDNGTPMPGEFHIEVDVITVQSQLATKPNPRWTYVDDAGHWHAYDNDGNLPTLEPVTRHVECDGSCSGACGGEGYDVTDWHCRICSQQVEPERLPDHDPHQVPGRKSWWAQVITEREINAGRAVVRIRSGDRLYFGVAFIHTVGMEGDSNGVRVTTRIEGIGPLGERRG